MKTEPPHLESLEQFFFQAPLYAPFLLVGGIEAKDLYGWGRDVVRRVDGHCPYCHSASIFDVSHQWIPTGPGRKNVGRRVSRDQMSITCVRDERHTIQFYFLVKRLTVLKIGQHPSLADISLDEASAYRANLGNHDSAEFHKAIGLAAHGVGVGSFVYLRRVFERLIQRRFEELKLTQGWQDDQFNGVRMEDKIELLEDHLPEFLVENKRIYSILSKGLHELDEETCLGYFEVMKQSIIIILEDDKKKKEELERRALFSNAISGFSTPSDTVPEP